jgi:hypothetical protein
MKQIVAQFKKRAQQICERIDKNSENSQPGH